MVFLGLIETRDLDSFLRVCKHGASLQGKYPFSSVVLEPALSGHALISAAAIFRHHDLSFPDRQKVDSVLHGTSLVPRASPNLYPLPRKYECILPIITGFAGSSMVVPTIESGLVDTRCML